MKRAGFTLIELSIVLVIIGLLIGGIMVGRTLIEHAKLRNILNQIEQYRAAVNTFRVKYNCLPGDCPNATAFWGASASCVPVATATASIYNQATCNGNGDGRLTYGNSYASDPGIGGLTYLQGATIEHFLFWQHLSNAGLLDSNYTGIPTFAYSLGFIAGVNMPVLKSFPAVIVLASYEIPSPGTYGAGGWFPNAHYFRTGVPNTSHNYWPEGEYLSVVDIYALDVKTDDGLPHKGSIMVFANATINTIHCVSTQWVPSNPVYDLSNPDQLCNLTFRGNF